MKRTNKYYFKKETDIIQMDQIDPSVLEALAPNVAQSFNYTLLDSFELEDLDERRLYINGIITDEILDSIGYHILRYNRLDKNIEKEKRIPIVLYINTDGGDIYTGNALISIIRNSITPVHTVNLGRCFSMGFLIFIAGEKRYTLDNGIFLHHDGSNGGFDSSAKLVDRIEFEKNVIEKKIKDYVVERTKITPKSYDKNYRREWYMDAEKALELHITDYVIGDDCSMDEII